MPYIDISAALLSPAMADRFTVMRRTETINDHGRAVIVPTPHANVIGVVTASSKNDLERLDDNQRMGRHLTVVTKFRLRGPSPGFQPDIIVWNGDSYVVELMDPYPQFGQGFVQAIVGSMDHVDLPVPGPVPQGNSLDFSQQGNSALVPII